MAGFDEEVAIPLPPLVTAWLPPALRDVLARGFSSTALGAVADQTVVSLSRFATGVIVGRACSRDEFGRYAIAWLVILAAIEVQSALVSTPYTVYAPRLDGDEGRRYTGSTLIFIVPVAAALIALTAGAGVVAGLATRTGVVLEALSVALGAVLAREHVRRICFAAQQMASATRFDLLVGAIQLGGIGLLAWRNELSSARALLICGAGAAIGTVTWLALHRREFHVSWRSAKDTWLPTWRLGRWMTASGLLAITTVQIYPWLLAGMRGPAATAVWAAGGSIANFTNPLVQAMTNYIGPAAAAGFAIGGRPSLQRIMRSTSWLFVVAMMPACIAILIWGGWIVAAFYGSDYAGTGPVASLLMLNVVPVGLSVIASRGLFAVERADVDFRVNLIPLAMAAAVGVPMIRFYGAAGAAAAAFLANVAATAVRYRRVAVSGLTIGTTAGL